jgi:primosomal replication protein N
LNQYTVTAKLVLQQLLRYTPAGIPALDVTLEHEAQDKDGHDATIQLTSIAFGMTAQTLAKLPLGSLLKVNGFLRHSQKSKKLIVQIETFEII